MERDGKHLPLELHQPKKPGANRDKITGISLEYDIVTEPELAGSIRFEYDKMVLLYDRLIQHSQIPVNKSDTKWNWSFNNTCKSLKGMKGILVLFEEEKPY